MIELVVIELVMFHMIDGRTIQINPAAVQQLIPATEHGNKLMAQRVECLIKMTGGYVSVIETCEEVKQKLEGTLP